MLVESDGSNTSDAAGATTASNDANVKSAPTTKEELDADMDGYFSDGYFGHTEDGEDLAEAAERV
jgi:hypothetical protein